MRKMLMKNAANMMDGLSMHSYTIPGGWNTKNRATVFTKDDYWETLSCAADIDRKIEGLLRTYERPAVEADSRMSLAELSPVGLHDPGVVDAQNLRRLAQCLLELFGQIRGRNPARRHSLSDAELHHGCDELLR